MAAVAVTAVRSGMPVRRKVTVALTMTAGEDEVASGRVVALQLPDKMRSS